MSRIYHSKSYENIPAIYDHIMRKVHYQKWSEYIYEIVKDSVPQDSKVLELAAGNCRFTNYFKKYYPGLIATDISLNMLLYDKVNVVDKVCADMTMLPFRIQFNLIYSNFDSLNYITTKRDLLKFFRAIFSILSDNGLFTFDVSLERNSLRHSKIPVRKGTHGGISFEQRSEYNKITRIHKNIFKLKFADNKEIIEIHKQKIYSFEEYFKILEIAGLYVVNCYNAFSFREGNENSERIQFVTKKVIKNAYMQ